MFVLEHTLSRTRAAAFTMAMVQLTMSGPLITIETSGDNIESINTSHIINSFGMSVRRGLGSSRRYDRNDLSMTLAVLANSVFNLWYCSHINTSVAMSSLGLRDMVFATSIKMTGSHSNPKRAVRIIIVTSIQIFIITINKNLNFIHVTDNLPTLGLIKRVNNSWSLV
jgi:hypothetical protein